MGLEQVGVEAIIAGMASFDQDSRRFRGLVLDMGQAAKQAETDTGGLGDVLAGVGGVIQRVGEIAAGILTAQIFQNIAAGLQEIALDALQAAAEFQRLTIQFEGLFARELVGQGVTDDFAEALRLAVVPAHAMLDWVRDISVQTPFTPQSLARTVALSMAMGFASDEAQDLAYAVGNFTAGMGLEQDVMERIIYNFGQMRAAGKVTGTELRDLARGGFVPIVDVLHRMQENLGRTNMSFDAFRRAAGAGRVDVNAFFEAFEQISTEQFPGAMERMMHTWQGVMTNIQELLQMVFGWDVFGPIVNRVTTAMADALEALMTPEFMTGAEEFGRRLNDAFGGVIYIIRTEFIPAVQDLLTALFGPIQMPTWEDLGDAIEDIRTKINLFIAGPATAFVEWITKRLIPGIEEARAGIVKALDPITRGLKILFDAIKDFWSTYGEAVIEQFRNIGDALAEAFGFTAGAGISNVAKLLSGLGTWITQNGPAIVDAISKFADAVIKAIPVVTEIITFIVDNWSTIVLVAGVILGIGKAFSILGAIITGVLPIFVAIWGAIITVLALLPVLPAIITGFVIGVLLALLATVSFLIGAVIGIVVNNWDLLKKKADMLITVVSVAFQAVVNDVMKWLSGAFTTFVLWLADLAIQITTWIVTTAQDAYGAATTIGSMLMQGILDGIQSMADRVRQAMRNVVRGVIDIAGGTLKSGSLSKVFAKIGREINEGFAAGITKTTRMPQTAIAMTVANTIGIARAAPAAATVAGAGYTDARSYSFEVNPNYSQMQSAASVQDDLLAMIAMIGGI